MPICWTVASYIAGAPRAAVHHAAHIARHVWRGKRVVHAIYHHAYVSKPLAAGIWKLSRVCAVAGGIGGAVGGAHLVGVPFPPVSTQQLVDALCCGQSPLTHVQGPPGTWASGPSGGLAGYPDRPVRPVRVPEPSSALILFAGAAAIVVVRRRI